MRKLRVFESISIDGYFTDATGDMSWAYAGARVPVALGAGRTVFSAHADLKLVDSRSFANGRTVVTYAA